MQSKLNIIAFVPSFILVTVFTLLLVGITKEGILQSYSLPWFLSVGFILIMFYWIISLFRKIPTFTIKDQVITHQLKGASQSFTLSDIQQLAQIPTRAIPFVTARGGLSIQTAKGEFCFPYHIYQNEAALLKAIHQVSLDVKVYIMQQYGINHLFYLRKWYRNSYVVFLLPMLGFVYLLVIKYEGMFWPTFVLSIIPLLIAVLIVQTSQLIHIEGKHLAHISPMALRKRMIPLEDIDYVNSSQISTGRGGLKNMTVHLKDKQILTLHAGLNKQQELNTLASQIHANL